MYADFSRIYDKLQEIDYNSFIAYYEEMFKKFNLSPKRILDLGCGSGNITIPLAERGYNMTGLDLSADMLALAREKSEEAEVDVFLLNTDMTDFELDNNVDAVICALDGVNYLPDLQAIENLFSCVKKFLNPGGIFIFDLNSEYKMRYVLDENTFIYDEDDMFCAWSSSYDEEDKICSFFLDFFIKTKNGLYERAEEYQEERAFSTEEIKNAAKKSGLEFCGAFDDRSFNSETENSERIFYVVKTK